MAYPLTTPREALLAFAQHLDEWAEEISADITCAPERITTLRGAAEDARLMADDQRCEVPVLTKSSDGAALYWRPGIASKEPAALLLISAAALDCIASGQGGQVTHPAALIAVLKEGLARFDRCVEPVSKVPAVRAEREQVRDLVKSLIVGLESGQIEMMQFERLTLHVDPVDEEVTDAWHPLIAEAVRATDQVRMRDILELACGIDPDKIQQKHARRAGAILRTLGFEPCVLPRDAKGHRERAWRRS